MNERLYLKLDLHYSMHQSNNLYKRIKIVVNSRLCNYKSLPNVDLCTICMYQFRRMSLKGHVLFVCNYIIKLSLSEGTIKY